MTSLPTSLTAALTAILTRMGEDPTVTNVFTELQLYLENNKDQLDVANTKNIQLEAELNQVTNELNTVSQSLAMALARLASSNLLGGQQAPKPSKIFADSRIYDSFRDKKFEEWWTCVCVWQDENSATLTGVAGIHTMLSRMVGRDTDWQIVKRLILEKGHYTSVVDFKKDLKQAGSRKQLLNFIKSGMAERAKTKNPNAMDIDATQSGNNKYFNCSREHFTKECKKLKLQCSEHKFLSGGHKKDCSHWGESSHQACSAKTEEGATSWDEDKSTKKDKEDKGKGWDWSKSIQGMSLDKAWAWFKDYKTLAAKSKKA